MRMPESLSRLTVVAGLAGVAAMVGYVTLFWESNQPAVLFRGAGGVAVDFVAEQPRGTVFDGQGVIVRSFTADNLTHFRAGDRSELAQPRFESTSSSGKVWLGAAREGTLFADERLELRGDVAIVDAAQTTRLDTERLQWHAGAQQLSTDAPVRLTRDAHIVTAVGMRADLDRDRVELMKQVEGTHVVR